MLQGTDDAVFAAPIGFSLDFYGTSYTRSFGGDATVGISAGASTYLRWSFNNGVITDGGRAGDAAPTSQPLRSKALLSPCALRRRGFVFLRGCAGSRSCA